MRVPPRIRMDNLPVYSAFATSLGIGLLIGLERERRPESRAGLRTFALVALLGTALAMLGDRFGSGWIFAAGIVAVTLIMIAAYWRHADGDPGTTTTVALLICYVLGALLWFGEAQLAVSSALAVTVLLYFKTELHGVSRRLTRQDLVSFLQFAVISLIVLPLLPDRAFGPYEALNPHDIGLLVVLISGLSLLGYAALRITGERHGAALMGMLGGLASSTATTLVYARHVRANAAPVPVATVVVLLANLMVLPRLGVIAAAVAPAALTALGPVFAIGLLLGLAVPMYEWHRLKKNGLPELKVSNPAELRTAIGFGVLFAMVLLLTAWLNDLAGARGVYAVAVASGATNVDAISLSSLRMFRQEQLPVSAAAVAIVLAVLANLAFKLGTIYFVGGRRFALRVFPGFVVLGGGLAAGLLYLV